MEGWGGEEGNAAVFLDGNPDRSISQDEISHYTVFVVPNFP